MPELQKLRAYAAGLQELQEQERTILAREVHDNLAQDLIGLSFNIAWILKHLERGETVNATELRRRAENMSKLVENSIRSARSISTRLRPALLDTLGLQAAIEWLVEDFTARTGTQCELHMQGNPGVDSRCANSLFQLIKAILKDIELRSPVSSLSMTMEFPDNKGVLCVQYDGGHTDGKREASKKNLGLFGIEATVMLLGGAIDIEMNHDSGTIIQIQVPLNVGMQPPPSQE